MLAGSREKEGVCLVMQKMVRIRKMQEITKRQKVIIRRPQWQQQSLISHRASQEQHDPLWYQTPDMGLEGLVATIRSVEKLQAALVNELMKKRREESELGHRLKGNENCEYL
jgi:hypothetical protein